MYQRDERDINVGGSSYDVWFMDSMSICQHYLPFALALCKCESTYSVVTLSRLIFLYAKDLGKFRILTFALIKYAIHYSVHTLKHLICFFAVVKKAWIESNH